MGVLDCSLPLVCGERIKGALRQMHTLRIGPPWREPCFLLLFKAFGVTPNPEEND